jgi:DNA-binding NtrC family response regulator
VAAAMPGLGLGAMQGGARAEMKRRNILIVVAEHDEGELFARALEARRNYKCYLTGKEKEATTLLKDVAIDLVLMDVAMATAEDCSLLKRVRRDHPGLVIVLAAGRHQRDQLQKASEHGFQGSIIKPLKVDELRRKIDAFWQCLESGEDQVVDDR